MPQTEKQDNILKYKLVYTTIIIAAYLIGRAIPLYGINISSSKIIPGNAETFLTQAIGGDENRYSLFALGISPFMMASILAQIWVSFRTVGTKNRISPGKIIRIQYTLALILALCQAVNHVQTLNFRETGFELLFVKFLVVMELSAGALVVLWLTGRNRRYGLGGQTVLIYVNVIDGIFTTLIRHSARELLLPLMISFVVLVLTLVMEGGEKRIPMQRISIYNIYADKNYLAIKLNPVGVMPVMFSTAFLMLFRIASAGLLWIFPENQRILWWQENLVLSKPLGVGTYLAILYFLTIGFSMVMIHPKEIAEQLLKGGDSILNLHPGRETRKYLARQVYGIGCFSATMMGVCLGIPMLLQLNGSVNQELVMFPGSVMILTSLWYSLHQEFKTIKSFEAYQPFI